MAQSPECQSGGWLLVGPPHPALWMRRTLSKGKRATGQSGCVHFQADSCTGEKKKASCQFWQEYPRPQMHLPACPRCSLCLSPSGLLHTVLALIPPAASREVTGDWKWIAIRKQPVDNPGKGGPYLNGTKFSAPITNGPDADSNFEKIFLKATLLTGCISIYLIHLKYAQYSKVPRKSLPIKTKNHHLNRILASNTTFKEKRLTISCPLPKAGLWGIMRAGGWVTHCH